MQQEAFQYYWQPGSAQAQAQVFPCLFAQLARYAHPYLSICARREHYEQGSDTGGHCHEDFYALYIVQAGRGVHVINDHPYGIVRGDVYLMPSGAIHAYRDFSALVIDAFYFQPDLFEQAEFRALRELAGFWRLLVTFEVQEPDMHDQTNGKSTTEASSDHRLHLSPEQHRVVEDMLNELYGEFPGESREAVLLTRLLFFRLLVCLARWQGAETAGLKKMHAGSTTSSRAERSYKADITTVLRICDERFHEPLSVAQLATYLFLSPSRFSELFLREVGMSPASYIRRLRLERAQTLLRTTSRSVTEIAHEVGFQEGSQLSRAFRAAYKLSPKEYRAAFTHRSG